MCVCNKTRPRTSFAKNTIDVCVCVCVCVYIKNTYPLGCSLFFTSTLTSWPSLAEDLKRKLSRRRTVCRPMRVWRAPVCVCVCERERERERTRVFGCDMVCPSNGSVWRAPVCVCVCVHGSVDFCYNIHRRTCIRTHITHTHTYIEYIHTHI